MKGERIKPCAWARAAWLVLMIGAARSPAAGQQFQSMEFRNQRIIDILMVLAEVSGTSIIPDETVGGTASFHFSGAGFEESLGLFLGQYKLHYTREGNVIRVSRISAAYDRSAGRLSVKAEDVPLESLIRVLGRTIGVSILADPLPDLSLSVEMDRLEAARALEICMLRLPGFSLEQGESYYYIRRVPAEDAGAPAQAASITRNDGAEGGAYTLSLSRGRFLETLAELFRKADREYSILTKTDGALENLYFRDKPFEEILRIILEQGNADYVLHNGIYYIVELQRRDILKKLKATRVLPLRHISAQEFPALLSPELAAGNSLRIDKNTNALILTGTPEEIQPLLDFAERIDRPLEGMAYRRFDLKYLSVQEGLGLIPPKMLPLPAAAIPQENAFVAQGSPQSLAELEAFITAIDRRDEGFPVRLKYIKIDELLKNLPPSVTKDHITDSGYPNLVFFTGPAERRELFLRELAHIDRPKPQIRYELLVVEYTKNQETRISRNYSAAKSGETSGAAFLGNLSHLMSLNFDVVAQFGYQFAASLNVQLGENTARVYADTTLNGLTGQEIRFQNTDTYRYQEFEVDADTGNVSRSGVTREISSGLIVALNGWVSGDDMITISVNATVSKQHNNHPGDTAGIPATSERVVNTQIRTPSGKPIVLSGLMKEDTGKNSKRIPLLGDIPLLGKLFGDTVDTKERTEIVIYIVPYLSRDSGEEQDIPLLLERYYRNLVEGALRN